MRWLEILYPELADLSAWTRARHPWATWLLWTGAALGAAAQALTAPRRTAATIRRGRELAARKSLNRKQTDSLYPLW
jgi:hypothetical protein